MEEDQWNTWKKVMNQMGSGSNLHLSFNNKDLGLLSEPVSICMSNHLYEPVYSFPSADSGILILLFLLSLQSLALREAPVILTCTLKGQKQQTSDDKKNDLLRMGKQGSSSSYPRPILCKCHILNSHFIHSKNVYIPLNFLYHVRIWLQQLFHCQIQMLIFQVGHEIGLPFSSEHMLTVCGRAVCVCECGQEEGKRPSVFQMHIHGETQNYLKKVSLMYLTFEN